MEAPGIAWTALVLGAILLGGGLAMLDPPEPQVEESPPCDVQVTFCPQGEALQRSTGSMLAWALLGMAMMMDVLFLGLTRGGTVLT
jgi:hypothetical protein